MSKNTETLENILRIREIKERMQEAGWGREDIVKAEQTLRSLRDSLGEGVRKTQAAEVLGISRQSLDRWISEGVLPVVSGASGRIEVSRQYLESLLPRVRDLRQKGNSDTILRQLRKLRDDPGQIARQTVTKKQSAPKKTAGKSAGKTARKTATKKTTKKTAARKSAPKKTTGKAARKTKGKTATKKTTGKTAARKPAPKKSAPKRAAGKTAKKS